MILALLIAAVVLAILATLNIPSPQRCAWGWAALACYFISLLVARIA